MSESSDTKCQNGCCDTVYHRPVYAKLDNVDLCRECYLAKRTEREYTFCQREREADFLQQRKREFPQYYR